MAQVIAPLPAPVEPFEVDLIFFADRMPGIPNRDLDGLPLVQAQPLLVENAPESPEEMLRLG